MGSRLWTTGPTSESFDHSAPVIWLKILQPKWSHKNVQCRYKCSVIICWVPWCVAICTSELGTTWFHPLRQYKTFVLVLGTWNGQTLAPRTTTVKLANCKQNASLDLLQDRIIWNTVGQCQKGMTYILCANLSSPGYKRQWIHGQYWW